MMRITLINQFYPPDLAPTGHMASSLAQHRSSLGDQVTIIASTGGYVPVSSQSSTTIGENPRVIRLWNPQLGKARKITRILDYATFYLLAAFRVLALPGQDIIISLTTPPFIAWVAVLHRMLHPRTKLLLWNMDCYPEIAEQTGVIREGGGTSRILRWLNRRLFNLLDHVISLDPAMQDLLQDHYGDHPSYHIIPNWEPSDQFPKDLQPPAWSGAPALPQKAPFVILYLGNAGFGHRFETVISAAEQLRDEPFVFLFVGGGQKWSWLAEKVRAKDLSNIILHEYVPKETTPSVMAIADCALITMSKHAVGLISPSKMHANLAMGLPILYLGPEGSNVDEAIKTYSCGLSLRHNQVDELVRFVRSLRDDPALHDHFRQASRKAFDDRFNDLRALPRFDTLIESLSSKAG
jgi:glycosyltransferase involved in cell wall biosynthesis